MTVTDKIIPCYIDKESDIDVFTQIDNYIEKYLYENGNYPETIIVQSQLFDVDCNKCKYINMTQSQQNDIFNQHRCEFYHCRVYHRTQSLFHSSRLYPCESCMNDNFRNYLIGGIKDIQFILSYDGESKNEQMQI